MVGEKRYSELEEVIYVARGLGRFLITSQEVAEAALMCEGSLVICFFINRMTSRFDGCYRKRIDERISSLVICTSRTGDLAVKANRAVVWIY